MIHATSKAVLVAWDMGLGPTFKGGARAHALYRVYRDGAPIGDTCAEAFYDANVRRGAVHTYTAFAVAPDGSETAVGPSFTVHVPRVAPRDRIAPTAPEDLTTAGWTPSSDSDSGVLAYFVERNSGPQPWAVLWNSGAGGATSGKRRTWRDSSSVKKAYRLRALDGALNLSEPSSIVIPAAYFTPRYIYYEPHVPVYPKETEAWRLNGVVPPQDVDYRLYRVNGGDLFVSSGHLPRGDVGAYNHQHMSWNQRNFLGDMPNVIVVGGARIGDAVTIMGTTFTAAASTSQEDHEFSVAGTDAQAAAELAACLLDPAHGLGEGYEADVAGNKITLSVSGSAYHLTIANPSGGILVDSVGEPADYRLDVDWPEWSVGTSVVFSLPEHTSAHHFTVIDGPAVDEVPDGRDGETFGVTVGVRPDYWDDAWGDWRESYPDVPQNPYVHYAYPPGEITCNCGANLATVTSLDLFNPGALGVLHNYTTVRVEHCPLHPYLQFDFDWARQPPADGWNGWSWFLTSAVRPDYEYWDPNNSLGVWPPDVDDPSNSGHWTVRYRTADDDGNWFTPGLFYDLTVDIIAGNGGGNDVDAQHCLISNIALVQTS